MQTILFDPLSCFGKVNQIFLNLSLLSGHAMSPVHSLPMTSLSDNSETFSFYSGHS